MLLNSHTLSLSLSLSLKNSRKQSRISPLLLATCNLLSASSSSSSSKHSKSPMADDIAQGFNYPPGRSTTNIFFNDDNGLPWSTLPWRPTPIPVPIPTSGPIATVCSSFSGLIICRVDALSDYYIGNPFAHHQPRYYGPLTHPPTHHPPHDTDVVLAVDHLTVMLPLFHVICAIRRYPSNSIYDFQIFSSTTQQWVSHPGINLLPRKIVPNTGVSCGRFAYWLTQNPHSVLRFDIASNSGMISFLGLPRVIPPAEQVRMQLGRAGDNLGLVIVSETASTVELYTHPLPVAENVWGGPVVFNIEIEADANIACRPGDGATLVCREMPRPMKFESFKMESLLWVSGKVVMLENNATHQNLYQVWELPVGEVPATIIEGVPHVCSHVFPMTFDWG